MQDLPSPTHPTPEQPTTHSSLKLAILIVLIIGVSTILFFTARSLRVSVIDWASHGGLAAVSMANCTIADVLGNWGPAKALSPGNCNGDDMVDGMDLALALSGGTPDPDGGDETEDPVEEGSEEEEETSATTFILPGTGFSGPTTQPAVQGDASMKAADQKAIARWSIVPYMTAEEDLNVAVVADHYHGINKVEFSVDGGPWVAISQPALNPQTNVNEYFATMRIADFTDGLHEVRAVVYPQHGIPRVLGGAITDSATMTKGEHSMFVNTNRDETLSKKIAYVSNTGNDTTGDGTKQKPFLTLQRAGFALGGNIFDGDASGGTIYLEPGDYNVGTYSYAKKFRTLTRFLTITPAPGVDRDEVRIVSATADGLRTDKVRFYNLTISPNPGTEYVIRNANNTGIAWMDNVYFTAQNWNDTSSFNWSLGWIAKYFTDAEVYYVRDTPISGTMARNVTIDYTTDALKNIPLVLNVEIKNANAHGTELHADVGQNWNPNGTYQNFYFDNVVATEDIESQGLFFHGFTSLFLDGVYKNVHIDNSFNGQGNVFINLHAHRPMQHVLFRDSVLIGCGMYRVNQPPHNIFSANDVLFSNVYKNENESVSDFCVPYPDGSIGNNQGSWPGTLPWLSPLGVYYQKI